jgi:hypothetical protein
MQRIKSVVVGDGAVGKSSIYAADLGEVKADCSRIEAVKLICFTLSAAVTHQIHSLSCVFLRLSKYIPFFAFFFFAFVFFFFK